MFKVPELVRRGYGMFATTVKDGNNGAFDLPGIIPGRKIDVLASDNDGWEHVSAKVWRGKQSYAIPNWEEMCYVKSLFWGDEDVVIQFHPKKSDYVNMHPYVLHLWRQVGVEFVTPPSILVGIK